MKIKIIIKEGLIQEILSDANVHIDIEIIDLDILEDNEFDSVRDRYNEAVNDKTLRVIY